MKLHCVVLVKNLSTCVVYYQLLIVEKITQAAELIQIL